MNMLLGKHSVLSDSKNWALLVEDNAQTEQELTEQ